ncbi:glycosyltransferase 29 protein [Cymbomonas tetramitiformis]|uniref:Glycosyltransferase 29 protein n=1 Tax=Cymbomonas tetramitiformis TaxID=36881 RepID=A0AAE0FCV6_9CHLO|nr:glycosyltransferase 29 protein [Cymbomonas tetramitiformis]
MEIEAALPAAGFTTKVYYNLLHRMRILKGMYGEELSRRCSPLPPAGSMARHYCEVLATQPRMWLLAPTLVTSSRAIWMSIKRRLEDRIQEVREKMSIQEQKTAEAQLAATAAQLRKFHYHNKPMSGMVAVYFSMQLCDQIDLYGFEAYKEGTKTPYHYFDRREGMTQVHSFDLAIDVFKTLGAHVNLHIVGA